MGLTDCISPNTYLSIEGKLRGVSQDVRVESLSDEEMEIQEYHQTYCGLPECPGVRSPRESIWNNDGEHQDLVVKNL